jgi:hypothetical protein
VANMPSPFTDGATILPIDAIQEFNLEENPKAEYGWKPGAVVNVGIKSGTNNLHGAAYAFGRDGSWDARNFYNVAPLNGTCTVSAFLSGCDQLPVQLKQFGGVVGGPIKKDKLFFFAGYEGLRSFIGSALVATTPATVSTGDPSASMVDAIKALQAAGITPNAVSLGLMGCTAGPSPTCTGGLFPNDGASNNFLSSFPNNNQSDNGIAKIDYHLSEKNAIFGTFFLGNYNATGEDHPFVNVAFTDTAPIRAWSNVESWVYTPNSRWVNELRFGYDRVDFQFINLDINKFADGKGGYILNTGAAVGGFPNVNIFGFTPLGTAANRPQYFSPNPYYDVQDSVSYLRGKHAFKFGGEFTHMEADAKVLVDGRGLIKFNGGQLTNPAFACPTGGGSCSTSLEDFFAGAPSTGTLLAGEASRKATWISTALFAEDDWRVTQHVTLNLGLRYVYVSPMNAANNLFGTFDPNLGMVQQGSNGLSKIWNADRADFEPRVGFAWDVTGKGTTVVRGGVTLIHSSWPMLTFLGEFALQNDGSTSPAAVPTAAILACNPGLTGSAACPATAGGTIGLQTATFPGSQLNWNGPVFPAAKATCGDGAANPLLAGGVDPSPCDVMGLDRNLRYPYVVGYNLSIQHQFGSNLSLEVGYVGNHGYRLLNFADINQAPLGSGWCLNKLMPAQLADACGPNATPGSYNGQAVQEARPFFTKFPYLGFINQATNRSYSNYNSVQLTLTKRMSQGLSFTGGYTFAHGLDNGSLNRFGGLPQDSTRPDLEYANSDFDIRHRFTFTTTYNVPGKKGYGQMLEGWQINSIITVETAQPWASFDSGDNISGTGENADRWDIVGNAADFTSGKQSIPYCFKGACSIQNPYGLPQTLSAAATASAISGCAGSAPSATTLANFGCYVSSNGKSFIVPPPLGQFGNMGRNIFRDTGFHNWDLSLFKNFTFHERFGAQFRWEVFNVLNKPQIANPYGSSSFVNSGNALGVFGLGFPGLTPDFAAGNPLIGSGSPRVMQLGLKLTF